ncbi:DNA repair protein RecO [Rhodobacteraceae bacterium]|nr:DNA repair protein RecO [Paracoccaceae bacterium]
MDWRETGILLSRRRHGENAAIIDVFTRDHGRHAGIVRGGAGRRMTPILEPGNQIDVAWRARLEDRLGTYAVEPVKSRAASLMADRLTLSGLNALTSLLIFALPEREAHPNLYDGTLTVLDMLDTSPFWPMAYLRWEVSLLEDLGFGLDLTACAVSGEVENLIYVSPKSGRAVSGAAAGKWKTKLLPLTPALIGQGDGNPVDVTEGLRTTGHFLQTRLAPALGNKAIPEARNRLIDLLIKKR